MNRGSPIAGCFIAGLWQWWIYRARSWRESKGFHLETEVNNGNVSRIAVFLMKCEDSGGFAHLSTAIFEWENAAKIIIVLGNYRGHIGNAWVT